MLSKYYHLFLLFPLFSNCFAYVHLFERTIASFDDAPTYSKKIKSCENCKFFIKNDKNEFSRCSKFIKHKHKHQNKNKFRITNQVQFIRFDSNITGSADTDYNAILNFYLATTCRNNETMCGIDAKHYERKYYDNY